MRRATNACRTVLTYIPISSFQAGIPNDFSFYFIAIANGASALGRILAGLLADRLGECRPAMSIASGVDMRGQVHSMSWLHLRL